MTTKAICDFCGRIIGGDYYKVRVKAKRRNVGWGEDWNSRIDLCEDCKEEIAAEVQAKIYGEKK